MISTVDKNKAGKREEMLQLVLLLRVGGLQNWSVHEVAGAVLMGTRPPDEIFYAVGSFLITLILFLLL